MKRNFLHLVVTIIALSLFIICLFFLEGEKKRERESNGNNKKCTEFRFFIFFSILFSKERFFGGIKLFENKMKQYIFLIYT